MNPAIYLLLLMSHVTLTIAPQILFSMITELDSDTMVLENGIDIMITE